MLEGLRNYLPSAPACCVRSVDSVRDTSTQYASAIFNRVAPQNTVRRYVFEKIAGFSTETAILAKEAIIVVGKGAAVVGVTGGTFYLAGKYLLAPIGCVTLRVLEGYQCKTSNTVHVFAQSVIGISTIMSAALVATVTVSIVKDVVTYCRNDFSTWKERNQPESAGSPAPQSYAAVPSAEDGAGAV